MSKSNQNKEKVIIAGLHLGHDCSFSILEDGKPIKHIELERIIRQKQPMGDPFQLLTEHYPEFKKINHFVALNDSPDTDHTMHQKYPYAYKMMKKISSSNGGDVHYVDHHQSHAANAFYSSNFDKSLIITMDAGGWDILHDVNGEPTPVAITMSVWMGEGKKINPLQYVPELHYNIGSTWNLLTKEVFGLEIGFPKGSQVGSVMAMASFGNPHKYLHHLETIAFTPKSRWNNYPDKGRALMQLVASGRENEKEQFDIAASLQKYTEDFVFQLINQLLEDESIRKKGEKINLCLAGGVALNCVMVGKMFDVFKDKLEDIYVCPVPYDAGLSIGSSQYIWHHVMENDRIKWVDNFTPYLGSEYSEDEILQALDKYSEVLEYRKADVDEILEMMSNGKIISLFHGGSESGRRALGNRSIVADPRNPDMKDIINHKVKHRQWYRPFAPSILKECVKDWFEHDVDSPYMDKAIKFLPGKEKQVPAVNHYDNTARLQSVSKNNNPLYYEFIKKWYDLSGVPIVLNTSFNDREPIVETPEDGLKCFLNTQIDHIYFLKYGVLVTKVE